MAAIIFDLLPLFLVGVVCFWELPLLSAARELREAVGIPDTEKEPDLGLPTKAAQTVQPAPPVAEVVEMVCEDQELIRMASKPQFVEDEEMMVTKRKERIFTRRRGLDQATREAWLKAELTRRRPS